MNKKAFRILSLLVVVLSFACKRPPVTGVSLPPSAAENTADKVNVQDVDFDYFKSKSKISYTDASNNQTVTVDIRIKRDSVIWLSISKLGIEGVRSLITRDSIFVLDRLNNDYQIYDFTSLSRKFNFPINFDFLQAAILGNLPVKEKPNRKIKVLREKGFYLLRQSDDSVTIDNYVSLDDLKLKKILVVEKPTNNSLSLNYENFSLLNNFLFPYSSLISLNYQSPEGNYKTVVTIQHTKAEISDKELKFPFAVPPKYERK